LENIENKNKTTNNKLKPLTYNMSDANKYEGVTLMRLRYYI
jgi:hypothetical protein